MRQPVLFLGHGSPLNAVTDNKYSRTLMAVGKKLLMTPPTAVLAISAHWETHGTFYTADTIPRQIYDMQGFPDELYALKYHPPGYPQMFKPNQFGIQASLGNWGLDHGTWSTLVHLFPQANIPIVQLSLDRNKTILEHYKLGQQLATLRDQNVLILGSGNIVHNLRHFDWNEKAAVMDWSADFDNWIHENISRRDDLNIITHWSKHRHAQKAVPTLEHFLPLIYCLGASHETIPHSPQVIFDEIHNGSISMRSYLFD